MSPVERLKAHYQLFDAEYRNLKAREARGLGYPPIPSFLDALQAYLEYVLSIHQGNQPLTSFRSLELIHNRVKERYQVDNGIVSLAKSTQRSGNTQDMEAQLDTDFGALMVCLSKNFKCELTR